MKNILEKIYDEKLMESLLFYDDYTFFKALPGVFEYFLTPTLTKGFLSKLDSTYNDTSKQLILTQGQKQNILALLNEIRFQFPFQNMEEKNEIIDRINDCVLGVNHALVSNTDYVFIPKQGFVDLHIESQCESFTFFLVYYYLKDDETFYNEAIPFFTANSGFYISGLYELIDDYPKLVEDRSFLIKTKAIVNKSLDFLKDNYDSLGKLKKKMVIKELKKISKILK